MDYTLTEAQLLTLLDAAIRTHDKERYDAVCLVRHQLELNPLSSESRVRLRLAPLPKSLTY